MRLTALPQILLCFAAAVSALTAVVPPSKWNYTYPWPIHYYSFTSQHQILSMAYMDVKATSTPNNKTIILLHGKNFCGATWEETAKVLVNIGYRVIIPDQIGFCKSSRPQRYQFSLQQLARNTYEILQSLEVGRLTVMGHSMGGMLASRFALMYPATTTRLIMVDPLGLEDWKTLGVPYNSIDAIYKTELASNFTSIKTYEQSTYYAGTWKPEYDRWASMLASIYALPGEGEQYAYDMALVTDMVFTQPVLYEFPLLNMSTLLIVGDKENTAIGKTWAPDSIKPLLGHYDVLGKKVIATISQGTLIEFPDLGHAPHIQDPLAFQAALIGWLDG